MAEKPKYRMGTGEKAFLWGIGSLTALIAVVAVPALIHQRDRARARATQERAVREIQPPMQSPAAPSTAPAPVQQGPGLNGDASFRLSSGADMNDHRENIPQELIPVVPITSLVEILPRPELVYPEEARSASIQGAIKVEVTIATNGVPITAVSQNGPVVLRIAAENWQMKRRFKPPVFEGLVQPVKVVNSVSFAIQ